MSAEHTLDKRGIQPGSTDPTPSEQREAFIEKVIRPLELPEAVIDAFAAVDRAEFVPPSHRTDAYTDRIIPLGRGSSISQPSLVAQMVAVVGPKPGDRALEVGTATGYQASVLSHIVDHVDTIEVNPRLAEQAQRNLTRLGYDKKITIHVGDGTKEIEGAKFDNIIVTAALKEMPQALLDQLALEGVMVAPVGPNLAGSQLMAYRKDKDGNINEYELGECQFVPIETDGASGWSEEDREQAEQDHYTVAFLHHVQKLGKSPEEEMKRLRADMAHVLGRKTPLSAKQVLKLGKLISDTTGPSVEEPVFEE